MPTSPHTKYNITGSHAGYNLTDSADFQTLVAGAGNGADFDWSIDDLIFLKNDTGGNAVFTIKVPPTSLQTEVLATVTSPTVTLATGKTYIFRLGEVTKDPVTGKVTITCDVAGKLLVVYMGVV